MLRLKKILKIVGALLLLAIVLFLGLFFFSSRFNFYVHTKGNAFIERAYEYRAVLAKDNEPGVGPGNAIAQPQNPAEFSFAVMGDTQMFNAPNAISLQSGNFRQAVSEIQARNPNIVMTVGDLIQSCHDNVSCDAYRMWKNIARPLLPITFEVMGNHDHQGGNLSDSQWRNYFNVPTNGPTGYQKLTYSFNYGNAHFVVLDSEHPFHEVDQTQQAWLDADLTNNKLPNVFVFWHEPAWPMAYKKKQSLDLHSGLRNSLWSIIDRHNVTAVFNGHEHIFSIAKVDQSIFPKATNSIYQIVSGHVDAPIKPNPTISPHAQYSYENGNYLIVNVSGQNVTLDLYAIATNQLVKSFNISK